MRYKRFAFLKMFCFLALFLGILQVRSYALNDNSGSGAKLSQISSEKLSRGRIFGNDILCMETFEFFEDYPAAWWFVLAVILVVIFGILFWIFTVDNTIPSEKKSTPFFTRFFRRSFRRKSFPDHRQDIDNENSGSRFK